MKNIVITYTDYNGNERTDEFWFNISKAELVLMEMRSPGGDLESYLTAISSTSDTNELANFFEEIIRMSYGVKTAGGGFDKNPAHFEKFKQSAAYNEILFKFITDTDFAIDFVNGTVEQNLEKQAVIGDRNKLAVERAKAMAKERIEASRNGIHAVEEN